MRSFKRLAILVLAVAMVFACNVTAHAATSQGTYPTRKGLILVTSDWYRGLIPTGHAAIVYNQNNVIEATASGVVIGRNNWTNTKRTVWGVKVKGTSVSQEAQAANWAYRQRGKRYNYNYYNPWSRDKFYCSQLVWAAYYDNFKINMNTAAFGVAVHPMELVNTSKTQTVFYFHR